MSSTSLYYDVQSSSNSNSSSSGNTIGIIVIVIALVLLIAVVIYFFYRRSRNNSSAQDNAEYNKAQAPVKAQKSQAGAYDDEYGSAAPNQVQQSVPVMQDEEYYDPNSQKVTSASKPSPAPVFDEEFYDPNSQQVQSAVPKNQFSEEFYDPNTSQISQPARPSNPIARQNPELTPEESTNFHAFKEFYFNQDYKLRSELVKINGLTIYSGDAITETTQVYGPKIVVKKIADAAENELSPKLKAAFQHESNLLWLVKDHPNFVKTIGISKRPAAILLKAYPRGSLNFFIASPAPFPTELKLRWLKDISQGLKFLHENALAYYDLKPAMVVIDEYEPKQFRLVFSDVGSIQVVDERPYLITDFRAANYKPTYAYLSPEAMTRFRHGARPSQVSPGEIILGDIYSLAAMIYEFLERKRPFN